MNALRVLGLWLLVAGGCLSVRSAYLEAKAELAGFLVRRAWAASLRSGRPHPPWPWADTHPIARLRIPRIGYDEMVLEDASPRNLAFGPARLLSSAYPGHPGNIVLAGHRTSWFRPLQHLRSGDRMELEWFEPGRAGQHQQAYLVSSIAITSPDDTSLLQPDGANLLTLITCYPFGPHPGSPKRFIVRAIPVANASESVPSAFRSKSSLKIQIHSRLRSVKQVG
jgi:sortase A